MELKVSKSRDARGLGMSSSDTKGTESCTPPSTASLQNLDLSFSGLFLAPYRFPEAEKSELSAGKGQAA